jgi:osmoprotectant transport system permease protein
VSLGGLGRFVIDGNNAGAGPNGYPQMAAGAIMIAVLALVVEGLLSLAQWMVVSPGLRDKSTRQRVARIWRRPTPSLVGSET